MPPTQASPPAAPRPASPGAGAAASHRRLRLALVAVVGLVGLGLIWPIYPLFAGARPFLFGLPLSLAWLVICMAVVFLVLVVLYRLDRGRETAATPSAAAPNREGRR